MSALGWTYLPPLKGTGAINFTSSRLAQGAQGASAREMLQQLTKLRADMLAGMTSFDTNQDKIVKICNDYLAVLQGLIEPPNECIKAGGSSAPPPVMPAVLPGSVAEPATPGDVATPVSVAGPERLRSAISFKWTDNVTGTIVQVEDVQYEKNCVLINLGLWLAKHATKLAQTKSDDEEVGKDIYRSLRLAAATFDHIQKKELEKYPYSPNTDMDERILEARVIQLLAEAQEVTIERARRKKHKPDLIAGLAHDNYIRFQTALSKITSVDDAYVGDFRRYLLFKAKFHEAYAFCFTGMQFFVEEKCGDSIKAFDQAKLACTQAEKLAKDYVKLQSKKVQNAVFQNFLENPIYIQLGKELQMASDKSDRENGFIYHHKIPTTDKEMCPAKALVTLDAWVPVEMNKDIWAKVVFDVKLIHKKGENMAADKAATGDESAVKPIGTEPLPKKGDEFCSVM